MPSISDAFKTGLGNVVVFAVMTVVAALAFYVTVFVVSTGAEIAGYTPDANIVVVSTALIVAASAIAAAIS